MVMRSVLNGLETDRAPQSWRVRRKVLLAVGTLVPVGLLAYSFIASLMSGAAGMAQDGVALAVSALLITGVGAYVIYDSLTSLARVPLQPRRVRRTLTAGRWM